MKAYLNRLIYRIGWDYMALIIIAAGLIGSNLHYKLWNEPNHIIVQDVTLYYQYLPATFIYKDLSMSFTDQNPKFFKDKIWKINTKMGRSVSKMTMGLAVLWSPFFLAAHGLAASFGYPADGYSNPYRIALIISSVIYTLIGFIFIIRLLRKYFARSTIAITILAIGLGTNLFFYTTIEPTMSHAYSFFLFAVFIFLVDAWVSNPSWLNSVFIGLVGGLIILVRPTNGILFILLLLWGIDSFEGLKSRFILFFRQFLKMAAIGLLAALVFLPQVIYWKYVTGDYFYYSYGKERFFFNDPAFLKGMFSYRKGWLLYTPIMAFSLLGIIVLYFRQRQFFWPVLVFTFLNLYIIWSWWCWWYGGGFGQRALIESYALLALPFAAFTEFIFNYKVITRYLYLLLIVAFISLNNFQIFQFNNGIIHWDSMSKKAYWDLYFRTKISPTLYKQIKPPDYEAAIKGER